ncbi:MAG TPA: hypothetical protein VJY33_04655, partial [Isosphaeraceae bacterium]|nr:hypothetical protein [Isosphaeraceae bacterium]
GADNDNGPVTIVFGSGGADSLVPATIGESTIALPLGYTVGAEADLGVVVLAVSVEQRLALLGIEDDAARHGCGYRVLDLSCSTQLYSPGLLSPLRGAI